MITALTLADALYLARQMRDIDVREIMATRADDDADAFAHECAAIGGWVYRDAAGVPVAMGGVLECWPGVGNAWMVATDDIARHGVGLSKLARRVVSDGKYHRVQAMSAVFHDVSHAWLEALGFERGALVRQFGKNGEDFILFERFNYVR